MSTTVLAMPPSSNPKCTKVKPKAPTALPRKRHPEDVFVKPASHIAPFGDLMATYN
jgi:hypothetical protein